MAVMWRRRAPSPWVGTHGESGTHGELGTQRDAIASDGLARLVALEAAVGVETVVVRPTSSGALIAVAHDVVGKLHAAGTDPECLTARLRAAGDPALASLVLPPHSATLHPVPTPDGPRWGSLWPRVEVVARDPDRVPWRPAAAALARLHRVGPPPRLPAHGAVDRLARGLRQLRSLSAEASNLRTAQLSVERAAAALPDGARRTALPGRPTAVVHGDWHLGQLGRLPRTARTGGAATPSRSGAWSPPAAWSPPGWLLIDLDDLGIGDPAWDFERPAALWAAGILPDAEWREFAEAYAEAGGTALPPGDPWPVLDAVARAGVVQAAAGAVRRAIERGRELDEIDVLLLGACDRIARR